MILNWFAPLPPLASGVAEYVAHLLPALCDRAEVTLWTEQEHWQGLDPRAHVRRYAAEQAPWKEFNEGDLSIYHLGNNQEYHGGPWLVARRHPGLLVMHDVSLPHFFVNLYRQRLKDRAGYLEAMEHFHGATGRTLATDFWEHRVAPEYVAERAPLTEFAVEGALGVLVHTPAAFEQLKPLRRWPLMYQPLAFQASTRRSSPPTPGDPFQLIVFGHIAANRRLDQLLDALTDFPPAERFHLHVYGSLWDPRHIEHRVRTPGLRGRVTLHGFVPDEDLDRALSAAHLAINLRYPTLGEGSISQLRIWDHALPTLVSQVGWYASLPAHVVAPVRPGYEVVDIRHHLQEFLENPDRFRQMGKEGRRYLEEQHAPMAYVDGLLEAADMAIRHRPRAVAYYLASRAGTEMSAWCEDGRRTARGVAEQIARLAA